MPVRFKLPAGHEVGVRSSLATASSHVVKDVPGPAGETWVELTPAEGEGTVFSYFNAYRLSDANSDPEDARVKSTVEAHPPWDAKQVRLSPAQLDAARQELVGRTDLGSLAKRVGGDVLLSSAQTLPGILANEMPEFYRRYPAGSLWYVSVEPKLMRRLAFMRVSTQMVLTPDIDYTDPDRDSTHYFGMHTVSHASNFGPLLHPALLAFMPTTIGIEMGVFPHSLVFLFGGYEDLREHEALPLAERFWPRISDDPYGGPGLKFPAQGLRTVDFEAFLQWWTSRLNRAYSHIADACNFADANGVYDPVAQSAWFFTFERMVADANALLSTVASPPIQRMQSAFDLLDKAANLLNGPGGGDDDRQFKRLLTRNQALPPIRRAFDNLPLALRPRFQTWAKESYERLYDDVKATTMSSRIKGKGVDVARTDPNQLVRSSWDDYVATLMRAARNSSHGLQGILGPPVGATDPRLLLATNSGDVPSSFYEVTAVIFFALMADIERVCQGSWW